MRFIFAIAIGIGIGYFAGFSDAQKHDRNIVERTVNKTGDRSRERTESRDKGLDSLSKP